MLMGFLGVSSFVNPWQPCLTNARAILQPCGMVSPHIHPRATEYLLNVVGPPLLATVIPENGADPVSVEIGPGNVTILPMGSVHMVSGTGCEPTLIVASFKWVLKSTSSP